MVTHASLTQRKKIPEHNLYIGTPFEECFESSAGTKYCDEGFDRSQQLLFITVALASSPF